MTDSIAVFPPGFRVTDSDHNAVPGAVVYFFDAGTDNPKTVHSNAGLSSVLGTSVTCDDAGYPSNSGARVMIYAGTASYKIVAKDGDGVLLWTHDNVSGALSTAAFLTTPSTTVTYTVSSITAATTLAAGDLLNKIYACDPSGGSFQVTLPAVNTSGVTGTPVTLRHDGASGAVMIASAGSDLIKTSGIDGARKVLVLLNKGDVATLVSDGVSWRATINGNIYATRHFVVEAQVTSPPVSPFVGNAYVIIGTPSGGFTSTTPACADGDVVVYDGASNWNIFRPSSNCGWTVYDKGTSTWFQYRASAWNNLASTDSAPGILQRATQAELESATAVDRAVVAGRMQYHPGVSKAWGSFAGAGSLAASYNITSITRTAAGTYTVTINNDLSTADYAVVASAVPSGTYLYAGIKISSKAAGSFVLTTTGVAAGGGTTVADMTTVDFSLVGDFA